MNINKICIVALLCACASMRIAAQDFYADYGIADPAVFSAMQRQSAEMRRCILIGTTTSIASI